MSLILEEHQAYLADAARVRAFRRALRKAVKPGDVVLDLGAGTAILGMLACEAGAGRVYCVDGGGIAQLAREIVEANGLAHRVTVIKGLSTRIELPERADVVVADQIGAFGFEAGVLAHFADAKQRLLKPRARAVPSSIRLEVALVEHPASWRRVVFWSRRPAGYGYEPARRLAENTRHAARLAPRHLLSRPVAGTTLDTLTHGSRAIRFERELRALRAGTLHGIGGWFAAQLAPGVQMTNSPLSRERIFRRNAVFPIGRPVKLAKGDRVRVAFVILPGDALVSWTVEIRPGANRASGGRAQLRFAHSTLKGMLIAQEDVARARPDSVPVISPMGGAERTVLALCNGRRTLAEVEAGLRRTHPALFSRKADATAFVAEIIARSAE